MGIREYVGRLGVLSEGRAGWAEGLTTADLDAIARRHVGRAVGSGHCVDFVRLVTDLPPTSHWRRGAHVLSAPPAPGTAIATFDEAGHYANRTDGTSHAAIFVDLVDGGVLVWDQWRGRSVWSRIIRHRGGVGLPVDDG